MWLSILKRYFIVYMAIVANEETRFPFFKFIINYICFKVHRSNKALHFKMNLFTIKVKFPNFQNNFFLQID